MLTKWFPDDILYQRYYPDHPLYRRYMEEEWGIPSHDDCHIFELLTIGVFAAGLNWHASFIKRPRLAEAFHHWDIDSIAKMTDKDVDDLMAMDGIIHNRRKIEATIKNAKAVQAIQKIYGSFDEFLWTLVNHKQKRLTIQRISELFPTTPESDAIAKQLKEHGFSFTGSVTVYAFMVTIGLVNARLDGKGLE
ncbi:DNA-3-methyladenine glycosylase I [Streptococcus gallolyticus]|uniref:DNA-3-methyladenine glycosylase n=1 Tax=Streptococcus gallolyticus TaxID=315405 RepID=A0A139R2Z6_9STRE|nr:DNA-3-methyladenine glycosylase I [Streptococcus gallolyticus]KXT69167.1 DNA-3-methyladenine glycosylase [Streptococcus gallolyticus]KXU09097.1 DNA-3-methyladenine glycosylase [Streptococcus gallolyticus]